MATVNQSLPLNAPAGRILREGVAGAPRALHLGGRTRATEWRQQLLEQLNTGSLLELDFEGIEATQSFVDELIGVIVLERGPDVMKRFRFRRCSDDMKAIINFVVSDRAAQYAATPRRR